MSETHVTEEMLAAGRAAGAQLASQGVFTDAWWTGVYRAMRDAESTETPPVPARGRLSDHGNVIERAVDRFAERLEHYLSHPGPRLAPFRAGQKFDTPGTMSWPPPGAS